MDDAGGWLWEELHSLFDTDDGSLPEIRLTYAAPSGVVSGFRWLRERATPLTLDWCFHSATDRKDVPVASVPNAATLVVSGEAEPFHVLLEGVRCKGVDLPDLGVFVFEDQLVLDYRMGRWSPPQLDALFRLLVVLAEPAPGASVSLEEHVPRELATRFQKAWQRYRAETTGLLN